MTASAAASLAVGDPAPAFALPAGDGRTVRLADLRGRQVVLYFYPKDDTPGCTKEACSFRDARAEFAKAGAVVLGVSCDSPASHRRFAEKFHLPFALLSDADGAVCRAYGVYKRKSMFGHTYWGIERTTVVIDERGRLTHIFPKVSVNGHSDAVLQALRDSFPSRYRQLVEQYYEELAKKP